MTISTSRSVSAASKAFRLSKRREIASANIVRVFTCTAAAKSISSVWIKNLRATVLRQILRDASMSKNRPTHMAKEAYSHVKNLRATVLRQTLWDAQMSKNRPVHMAKEAYSYDKRSLFIWQKRPISISIPERITASVAHKAICCLGFRGKGVRCRV